MMPPTTDTQRTAFANYAVATMSHFKGRNITWELFNEPNSTSLLDSIYMCTFL